MDHRQQYRQAQLGLIDVVKDLTDADLDTTSTCEGWTIRDILKHVIENAYATAARGEGVEYDPAADDRLGNDPREEYRLAADAAWEYYQRDEALSGTVDFAGEQRPAWLPLSFQFADTLIHQWDINHALNRSSTMRPELVAEAVKVAELIPEGDDFRGPGKGFGRIVPIDSDDPQDRLLSLTGRDPAWAPASA